MSHSTHPFSGDQFRQVESFALGAVLVFGFLVAAVLEQGDEDRGVGDECREEDVEGGEEGAQGLCEVPVDDHGHCVGGESDAEEWESEAGDDGCLSSFPVSFWWKGDLGWGGVPFSRESRFQDHGHGEEDQCHVG